MNHITCIFHIDLAESIGQIEVKVSVKGQVTWLGRTSGIQDYISAYTFTRIEHLHITLDEFSSKNGLHYYGYGWSRPVCVKHHGHQTRHHPGNISLGARRLSIDYLSNEA